MLDTRCVGPQGETLTYLDPGEKKKYTDWV